jgi:EmrB/QacA subfamily drug resistance transporter
MEEGVPMSNGRPAERTRGLQRRWLVLAICCMSLLIVGLDNTIVNVALPSIGRELHTQVAGLQWVVDGYTLVMASLLMLSGSMGDRLGRRRVFEAGLVVFTLASLLCSLAPSLGLLVAFRMLQGVGGSMLNPVAMSIIRNVFTDARERAQAIGMWGATIGISLALGPVVGGALVEGVDWRSVFWINVPIGAVAFALTMRFVPESRAPRPRRIDPVGQVLVIVMLASLTYALIGAPTAGWVSVQSLSLFALSALSLAAFVPYERRRVEPLLEPGFFRSVPFSSASAIAVLSFAGLGAFLLLNTLYLQDVRGLSALHAGLLTLPIAASTLVVAPISGRITGHRGPRIGLLVGGIGIGLGGALMSPITGSTPLAALLPAYLLFGIGFGMVNPPITNTAVIGMPAAQAGVAAAIASTSRQVGQTLGVALAGALAAGAGGAVGPDFVANSRAGWLIVAGCGVAVLGLGAASTTRRAKASAERVAREYAAPPAPAEAQPAAA